MIDINHLTPYQQTIRDFSERIVKAQQPIRVLDAIKWGPEIKEAFFKAHCKELPAVNAAYYQPLPFDSKEKIDELYNLERDIRRKLGQFSAIGNILQRMCREYRELVRMLEARGTPEFSKISQELYGSAEDVFYAGAPRLRDLAEIVTNALSNLELHAQQKLDEIQYTSEQAVEILGERLAAYFEGADRQIRVKISDGIIADVAAGAEYIKIRKGISFSERHLRIIEVHEGWVHMATTLNGLAQPICTFLSKGPPSSTITQEGLAIIMEIFTFASFPGRVWRLTDRVTAISMAENGANFLDVFTFFRSRGLDDEVCYGHASRVFRGSTPDGGPFTKDLVYSKGFVLIYNYIRLAIQRGFIMRIPLLFVGKTTLEDQRVLVDLIDEGLVVPPLYLPPQFKDLAALSAWMSYSLFLNRMNLEKIAVEYRDILQE